MNDIVETTGQPVLIVWMEDELVHTDDSPVCDDPTCPCRAAYDGEEAPSDEEVEDMYRNRRAWLSEHL